MLRPQVHTAPPPIPLTLALVCTIIAIFLPNWLVYTSTSEIYVHLSYGLTKHCSSYPSSPNSSDQAAGSRRIAIHSPQRMSAQILHLFVTLGSPLRSSSFRLPCWKELHLSFMSPCLTADMSNGSAAGKPYVLFTSSLVLPPTCGPSCLHCYIRGTDEGSCGPTTGHPLNFA